MKSIDTLLDRFCYKHPRFGIPNLMNVIVMGTVLVYLLDMFSGGISFSSLLYFSPYRVIHHFELWRVITFLFVPSSGGVLLVALELY